MQTSMVSKILDKSYDPHQVEEKWYRFWMERNYFRAEEGSNRPAYSIVIPPPNVTGVLHIGHALNNTLQDILIRFKRMDGFSVLWMPGTDHAGIATQTVVEKSLKKAGTIQHRDDLGREKFLEKVWEWKEKHGGIIIEQLKRLGASCDWPRTRFTMEDTAAMGLAWFVICVVPIGGIVLFWMVHVLPEKIAHKRHHAQRDAIQTLCLLSLVFGGLLGPLAWLWAYTKPVAYRGAYGTEKHDDYFREMGEKALAGELSEDEVAQLREELDAMAARGTLPVSLRLLRKEVAAAGPRTGEPQAAADAKAGSA